MATATITPAAMTAKTAKMWDHSIMFLYPDPPAIDDKYYAVTLYHEGAYAIHPYHDANDKHYALMLKGDTVILNDGKYIENVNPDRKPGEPMARFSTLDAWRIARVGESTTAVMRNTTRCTPVCTIPIDPAHGFNVPEEREDGVNRWFRWCYTMIVEAAPELLGNKEATTAYNDLLAACDKYPELKLFSEIGIQMKRELYNRYSISNIQHDSCWQEFGKEKTVEYKVGYDGFPVYMCSYYPEPEPLDISRFLWVCTDIIPSTYNTHLLPRHKTISCDIMPKYKVMYDVIISKLIPYMTVRHNIIRAERILKEKSTKC